MAFRPSVSMARRRRRTIIFNRIREMDLHKKKMNYTLLPSLLFFFSVQLVQNFRLGKKIFSISSDVWMRPRCPVSFIDHLFSSPPALIPKGPAMAKLCRVGGQTKFFCISVFWLMVTKALCCSGWVSLFKVGLGKYWPSKFLPGNWCISIFQNSCRMDKTNW